MTWLLQRLYNKPTSILALQFVHIENSGTRESFSFPQIHIKLSRVRLLWAEFYPPQIHILKS